MKGKRFVIVGCSHGDMIDPVAEKAVLEFIKDFKPQIRTHLGDGFDFRNLRRGASDEEKAGSLQDDWDMGSDFLRRFYAGGQINHYLGGNHCWKRLNDFTNASNGVMRDYANDAMKKFRQLIEGRCRAKLLPYDARLGILRMGHMKNVHGFFSGKNAPARHAAVFGNVIHAHTHAITVCPVESDRGPEEARGIGCLCKVDMEYNATQTNKLMHANGWAYGHLYDEGTYDIFQARRLNDSFIAAHEIKAY